MVIPCLHQRINNLWVLCFLLLFLLGNGRGIAQVPPDTTTAPLAVTATAAEPQAEPPYGQLLMPKIVKVLTASAGIGDELRILIDSTSAYAIEHNRLSYRELELFLDGMRFHSLNPHFISPNILSFPLVYDDSSRHEWRNLLGTLESATHTARVGMGFEGEPEATIISNRQGYTPTFTFVVYREGWFLASMACMVLAIVLFWLLATRTNIIRDTAPATPANGGKRPYSLARFQMALWFFIILTSYLFIFLLTGQYNNVLNEQALILIGIGTGTALGAALIDTNKTTVMSNQLDTLLPEKSKAEAERASLAAQLQAAQLQAAQGASTGTTVTPDAPSSPIGSPSQQSVQTLMGQIAEKDAQIATLQTRVNEIQNAEGQPVSQGFFIDILTDQTGVSFHRFQILMWTIILAAIFCTEVYQNLLMPNFNTTLLALMGISSGTYLGFKIPEQQGIRAASPPEASSAL